MSRCGGLLLVACLGCQGLTPDLVRPATDIEPTVQATAVEELPAPTVAVEANLKESWLLHYAASLLEQDKDAEAAEALKQYVARHPEQLLIRAQLGELLYRVGRWNEARLHFEVFIGLAQEQGESAFRYLIHCHSRLVEIAELQRDGFQEHLNRGIGLYLLACRRLTEPDPEGDCSATSLLLRSAQELQESREGQPHEARPHWYLYQAWSRLGQDAAAVRALKIADDCAAFSRLTAHERRELQVACLQRFGSWRSGSSIERIHSVKRFCKSSRAWRC